MGGGPGTSLYKSTDYGDNWFKIDNGLPESNMGKIGLAISPMKSNVLYAAIEVSEEKVLSTNQLIVVVVGPKCLIPFLVELVHTIIKKLVASPSPI